MVTAIPHQEADPYAAFRREDDDGNLTHAAGLPGYPNNFTQDGVESGIIGGSPYALEGQLEKSARHLNGDGLFWECPPEGSPTFGLKVTYWKDSILTGPNGKEEPDYPVAFGPLQFVAARGLLSAGRLLRDRDLSRTADGMFEAGIREFILSSDYVPQSRITPNT